jgi:hypothetical protein
VRHARLVGALFKAAAFARSKQQAPLHTDPQMLSLLPERLSLNRLSTSMKRRMSLDNSVLDRRRWQMMAAATAAATAADAASPHPRC